MANENAKIDDNRKRTLLGISDDASAERRRLLVDNATGRLLVSATISSGVITSLNGLTAATQLFATGTTGTDFGISSATATHTFNLPDASATARGVITTGAQTLAGVKTFSSFPVGPSSAPTTDYQMANKKYVDDAVLVENLWDRTGTILSPHTAGDSIETTGSLGATGTRLAKAWLDDIEVTESIIIQKGTQYNTKIGYQAGGNLHATAALRNTFVGYQSGLSGASSGADDNTAIGFYSLTANTTGENNTALGGYTLLRNTTGGTNTAVGWHSLYTNVTGAGNTALGAFAGKYETGSNAFYVDNQDRTNTAGDKAGALLYGTFNATPASQTLKVNGTLSMTALTTPYTKTVSVSPAGGDYTTIQAALTANATDGLLVIVYPGTYTDTINFTNNNQWVKGVGSKYEAIVTQTTTTVSNVGAYTGCGLFHLTIQVTAATSAVDCVLVSTGSINIQECVLNSTNASCATAGQPHCINVTGAGTAEMFAGEINYTNNVAAGTAIKSAILETTGSIIQVSRVDAVIATAGASVGSTFSYATGTGTFSMRRSSIDITDTATTATVGIYYNGSASTLELFGNNIHVHGGTATGIWNASSGTIRSLYNHIVVTSAASTAQSFSINGGSTVYSRFDTIIAANGYTNSGTFGFVNSPDNDDFAVSSLTASKAVFTDASKNLTSTGIGTSSQFIKGDGSLDSSVYLTAVAAHNLLSATHGDTTAGSALLGGIIYADANPKWVQLAGNTTTTKQYLSQTGTGVVSAVPAWAQVAVGDLSGFGANVATWLGTPSSANLAAAITDETGSGALIFGTAPTFTTSIAFNAVTDTIAGIQNQNLVDKTDTEGISGAWTHSTNPLTMNQVHLQGDTTSDKLELRGDSSSSNDVVIYETGIVDLEGQSRMRAYQNSITQVIPTATFVPIILNTESYDSQGEFDNTKKTGTAEAGYPLVNGTKYAMVLRATSGDGSNLVDWRIDTDASGGGYAGGNRGYSENSGTDWIAATDDTMFAEYAGAVKKQAYEAGDDTYTNFMGATWGYQTFTPADNHNITKISIKIYRVGSPGTITAGIRAVDGTGKPTGSDLISGTTSGNTLTTDIGGEWRDITLGTSASHLIDFTKAQFVAADVNRYVWNSTDNTYAKITAFNTTSDVTLDTDIFVSGETYTLYGSKFTATKNGYYQINAQVNYATVTADKYYESVIYINGSAVQTNILTASTTDSISPINADVYYLAANDTVHLYTYHNAGVTRTIQSGAIGNTYLSIHKLS